MLSLAGLRCALVCAAVVTCGGAVPAVAAALSYAQQATLWSTTVWPALRGTSNATMPFAVFIAAPSMQLDGTLATEIGELTALARLVLYDNALHGTLPSEIGNLIWLQGVCE